MAVPCLPLTAELRTVLDFANTLGLDPPADELSDLAVAEAWLEQRGLPSGLTGEADLARLREFRAALRSVLEANGGGGASKAAWEQVQPFARSATLYMVPGVTPGLVPAGSGLQATVGALLAASYDAVRAGSWTRLKLCREPACRWAFYDQSKNGSGAWCSMRVCGNRNKARRRRERSRPQS